MKSGTGFRVISSDVKPKKTDYPHWPTRKRPQERLGVPHVLQNAGTTHNPALTTPAKQELTASG